MIKTKLYLTVFFGVVLGFLAFTPCVSGSTVNVCQFCDSQHQDYKDIQTAIDSEPAGTVIDIWAEEDTLQPGEIYVYDLSAGLDVDKEITLTCSSLHPSLGYPVISHDFSSDDEVIDISHDDVEISNLIIRGPDNDILNINYPLDYLENDVGIRVTAGNCRIENVTVLQCMTGVTLDSSDGVSDTGNQLVNCQIGDRYIYTNNIDTEEYWVDMASDIHPGNGFGVVEIAPVCSEGSNSYIDITPNEIVDCTIRSNRFYGLVLTNGSRAKIAHNIIAWNGDINCDPRYTPTPNAVVPDKTGGILSLFTEAQITANDNKLQSPMIMSNNIYGNLGYQVGILTDGDNPVQIRNSPVLLGNTIGTQSDMGDPEGTTSINMENFLISCGPVPDVTPSPTPPPGNPTSTPQYTDLNNYNYHGSAPIMAWNCLSNPDTHFTSYHPMQPDTLAHTPTQTPTPTDTPSAPTLTPTPTPDDITWKSTPTGRPLALATSTPSLPTSTPEPGCYQISKSTWSLKNQENSPAFVGWTVPTVGPPVFDWHLMDITGPNTPTPTGTPEYSICFNHGGLLLDPGISTVNMMPDDQRIDIGYHSIGGVPNVEDLDVDWVYFDTILRTTWSQPTHYADGSALEFSDVGGYIYYYGTIDMLSIKVIGSPKAVEASQPYYIEYYSLVPALADFVGIVIYDVRGVESSINWMAIPD